MNLQSLQTLVIQATGRTDKSTLIDSAINLAVAEFSSQRLWSDLLTHDEVTLVSGALSVDLDVNVARVLEVTVVDGQMSRPLLCRSKSWVVERFPDPASKSPTRPVYGYLEGRVIWVAQRPNQDYVLRYSYYKLHPELTVATDELLIRHASAAVAAYANFWVFQSIEKMKESEQWYKIYLSQLKSAKQVDSDNSVTKFQATPRGRVRPDDITSWGDYWLDPFVKHQP